MQNLLLIDTTSPIAQVGLKIGPRLIQRHIEGSMNHTEQILPMIQEVLEEAKLPAHDVDAVSVTKGPGGFAGVRVGFCVGQGLAYGWQKPFIPLSTLEVLAMSAYRQNPSCEPYLILLDAKMNEAYSGLYQMQSNNLIALAEDTLLKIDSIPEYIASLKIDKLNLYSNIESDTMMPTLTSDYFLSLEAMSEVAMYTKVVPTLSAAPSYIRNQVTQQSK